MLHMRQLLLSVSPTNHVCRKFYRFLFLSFILIDKNKRQWISLCICMALFHNYFYTPGMILILLLYDYDQNHTIKDILIPILIGMGMATILWLPTGYLILNNHKSVVQTNLFNLLIPNFTLKGLVYDSYGCGLTVISWIALFQGIQFEKTRKLSILLILMFVFPIFSYILNGALYARTKILVLCLPLILMILAHWLQERKLNKGLLVLASLFLCTKTMFIGLLISLVFIGYYFMDKKRMFNDICHCTYDCFYRIKLQSVFRFKNSIIQCILRINKN